VNGLSLIDALRRCWFTNPTQMKLVIDEFKREPDLQWPMMKHPELGEIYARWTTFMVDDIVAQAHWDIQRILMNPRGKTKLYYLIHEDIIDYNIVNPITYGPYPVKKICIAIFLK
jgi:hypothetical protein